LLEEFSQLDAVLEKPLSRIQALHHLRQLAQETVFQPQTTQATVQVLGLLEAIGLPFAGLWISGMTQENWPGRPTPNPFIPLALQRERNMPHASAARELAYSRTLTQHFLDNAQTVIFSYPRQQEDRPQAPSALIQELPEGEILWRTETAPALLVGDKLEYLVDDKAPAVQPGEVLRGGASLFKHQAACPFRAFARLRLGAVAIPAPATHMTPQERGICLHAILEQTWRQLGDHATLCSYDEQVLEQLLKPLVQAALRRLAKARAFTLKPHFLALEAQRLTTQVLAWLALEKQRPPFQVVTLESAQTISFAGLSLTLRVDREDKQADGTHLLIDYKTGGGAPTDWVGERPNDPQLLLYGLISEQPIEGLAFAQISAERVAFSGVSKNETEIPGMQLVEKKFNKTWEEFLTEAHATLIQLAEAFQQGDAPVDPKELEKTCQYCDLQSVCRVYSNLMTSR
jgi:probable DNA repair protein